MRLVVRQKEEETISPHDLDNEKGILLVYKNNDLDSIYFKIGEDLMIFNPIGCKTFESLHMNYEDIFNSYDYRDTKIYLYNGNFQDIKYNLED